MSRVKRQGRQGERRRRRKEEKSLCLFWRWRSSASTSTSGWKDRSEEYTKNSNSNNNNHGARKGKIRSQTKTATKVVQLTYISKLSILYLFFPYLGKMLVFFFSAEISASAVQEANANLKRVENRDRKQIIPDGNKNTKIGKNPLFPYLEYFFSC